MDGFHYPLVDRFEYQRHADENGGVEFLHILQHIFEAVAESDLRAAVGGKEQNYRALIGVVQRQHRDAAVLGRNLDNAHRGHDLGAEVPVAEHDAL